MEGWTKDASDPKSTWKDKVLGYLFFHGLGLALGMTVERFLLH